MQENNQRLFFPCHVLPLNVQIKCCQVGVVIAGRWVAAEAVSFCLSIYITSCKK